jgi:hypothetical protein
VATPERRVKAKCAAILQRLGAYYFYPAASVFSRAGIPDLIACLPPRGHFIAIECKFGRNRVTRLQAYELSKIKQSCGTAIVVTDKTDFTRLEEWLVEIGSQPGIPLDSDTPPELVSAYLDEAEE